jgi:hypothetical protein
LHVRNVAASSHAQNDTGHWTEALEVVVQVRLGDFRRLAHHENVPRAAEDRGRSVKLLELVKEPRMVANVLGGDLVHVHHLELVVLSVEYFERVAQLLPFRQHVQVQLPVRCRRSGARGIQGHVIRKACGQFLGLRCRTPLSHRTVR